MVTTMVQKNDLLNLVNKLSDRVAIEESRLQKVETRNLRLAGTGERLMISNGYNRHNARYCCSPVPNIFTFCRRLRIGEYFLQAAQLIRWRRKWL